MVTSHTNDELNGELRSANKSAESRHQKFKFAEATSPPTSMKQQALQHPWSNKLSNIHEATSPPTSMKQQALQHPVQKQHLSIEL